MGPLRRRAAGLIAAATCAAAVLPIVVTHTRGHPSARASAAPRQSAPALLPAGDGAAGAAPEADEALAELDLTAAELAALPGGGPAGCAPVDPAAAADCRLVGFRGVLRDPCLPPQAVQYIAENLIIAVNTGGGLFRIDLALCSWLRHVPPEALFVFTDGIHGGDGGGRKGRWINASDDVVLPPGLVFSREQEQQRGYHLSWRKAQFRFLYALRRIIEEDRRRALARRWFMLVDDDTFISITALVAALRSYDANPAPRGRYLGDTGWGGAGHVFDRRASAALLKQLDSRCIRPFMVRGSLASDEALAKCVPAMGVRMVKDARLSHCHGAALRDRMLMGTHISMHLKRDVSAPEPLTIWRVRLYYQVVYHGNVTAYRLLHQVGSCGYGSCRSPGCDEAHDRRAVEMYLEASSGGAAVPSL
eukprot:TRINITY_DN22189_c1_g1_i3.p4 TRINITY_DN22189_c1_g1~~TRINITY_DN22189_c1_g1_i3.p4  ORF type:complete len:419 (+),score=115.56 TRINITY_DN22189_c1_g1_i3:3057-4313(+)